MTLPRQHSPREPLPHRGRAWLFGVVVPVVLTAAALGLVTAWRPRLPDEVVTHWGPTGVEATGPASTFLLSFGAYAVLTLLLLAVLSLTVGRSAMARRMVLGIATGNATLNAGMMIAAVEVQLDLTDARTAPDPGSRLFLAALVAVAAGFLAAALAGADGPRPATRPVPADVPRATLADGEEAVWVRRVSSTAGGRTGWYLAVGLLLGLALWLGWASGSWWAAALLLLPLPLAAGMLVWDVRVAPDGLTARARLGRPRLHVPAAEVEAADVVDVEPFAQFGGWGLRIAPDLSGTVGVVVRKGEGIRVQRSGGRRVVVTVDDAADGAALLNTYAERAGTSARS